MGWLRRFSLWSYVFNRCALIHTPPWMLLCIVLHVSNQRTLSFGENGWQQWKYHTKLYWPWFQITSLTFIPPKFPLIQTSIAPSFHYSKTLLPRHAKKEHMVGIIKYSYVETGGCEKEWIWQGKITCYRLLAQAVQPKCQTTQSQRGLSYRLKQA